MVKLVQDLEHYLPQAWDDEERAHILKTIDFVRRTPLAFERENDALGHIGASALVWNPAQHKVLLTVHTVTGERSFFGNHADGSHDLIAKARERVAKEISTTFAETIQLVSGIFDVDVHYVPPHERHGKPVQAHLHYDIMYLFETSERVNMPPAFWFTVPEVQADTSNLQMQRLLTKLANRS